MGILQARTLEWVAIPFSRVLWVESKSDLAESFDSEDGFAI